MCTTQSEVTFTPAERTRQVAAGDVGGEYGPDSGAPLPILTLIEAKFLINGKTHDRKGDFVVSAPYLLPNSGCAQVDVTCNGDLTKLSAAVSGGELNFQWGDPELGSFTTTARISLASIALRPAV